MATTKIYDYAIIYHSYWFT